MIPFKFFRDTKYILSSTMEYVPSTTPIGLLNGYVDHTLNLNRCVPYRVIVNGISYDSEVAHMSFKQYISLCQDSNMDIRLCAVVMETSPTRDRVYEMWNGIDDRLVEYPSEFLSNPDNTFWLEILKLPRHETL